MNMKLPERALPDASLHGDSRSIGEILIEAGRLNPEAAKRIALAQSERGLRFGEAAIGLNLLTAKDIQFALARQFEYSYIEPSQSRIDPSVVAAYRPFDPVTEQMRSIRSRLVLRHLENQAEPRSLAIVGAMSGEGRSFIAANLAVVFSQMGERTLLIDADMRQPAQHRLFNVSNQLGLSNLLLGRAGFQDIKRVPELRNLAILTAGSQPPNPQELLTRPRMATLIGDAASVYDIVIIDTPATSVCADAQIIASRAGASLLVGRSRITDGMLLKRSLASLRDSGANLIGSVLNDA